MKINEIYTLLIMLLGGYCYAQIPVLSQSKSRISNPDRGFRYEAMALIPDYKNPWGPYYLSSNTWLKFSEADFDAKDGHIRLGQLYIYLTHYANTDHLSDEAINKIEKLFTDARTQGYSLIVRFAYTYDKPEGQVYPPMKRILKHIDQLSPIIKDNMDIISVLQAGFVGIWGEWHSDNNIYSSQDKDSLMTKIIDLLPEGRSTQMRLPKYKNALNLPKELKNKIGFHNDYFTDSSIAYALSKEGFLNTQNSLQVSKESQSKMVDGEMPYTVELEFGKNHLLNPLEVLKQLKDNHYSTFSVVHNYSSNIANWKSKTINKNILDRNNLPYDPDYFKNGEKTYYDYIADYLGYRLFFNYNNSFVQLNNFTGGLNYSLSLSNFGFASIPNPRELFLIILDINNKILIKQKLQLDFNNLGSEKTQVLKGKIVIPKEITKYTIGLWLPNFPLSKSYYNPNYSIRISNTNWFELNIGKNQNLLINEIYRSK